MSSFLLRVENREKTSRPKLVGTFIFSTLYCLGVPFAIWLSSDRKCDISAILVAMWFVAFYLHVSLRIFVRYISVDEVEVGESVNVRVNGRAIQARLAAVDSSRSLLAFLAGVPGWMLRKDGHELMGFVPASLPGARELGELLSPKTAQRSSPS